MKNKFIYILGAIIIEVDQLSKVFITKPRVIIPNFWSLNPVSNPGAAWSLFSNRLPFLILFSLVMLIVLFRYQTYFKMNWRNKIAFGCLYGGLLGNLLDRVFLGYVRDFLAFNVFGYHYPVFNLADVGLVLGVFLLMIAILKGEDRSESNQRSKRSKSRTH